ncbi:MAG TPA: TolC family protein [Phycisphaerales bacterium]|nr:TolC family protein [Phycisphaerales bacterium]
MRRAAITTACLSLPFLLAACEGNPFAANDGDYAKRVALERLRDIPPSRLEEFKRPTPPTPQDAAAARLRFAALEKLDLPLEEARAQALRHNLDLKVALVNPTIAAQQVSLEEARFESAFTLRAAYSEIDAPTSSQLSAAQSKNLTLIPGVRIPTRTGGQAVVRLPIQKNENNNPFSTLNPAYSSDLEFSLSHELLRGAGRRANTAALRIAGYNLQATEAQTKLEVIRQLAAVDRSYWRLFQARRELEVAQQQYELATDQEARAQRRVDSGLAAPIEVTRAQAGSADRLEAIIVAQNNVQFQQRELKRIINIPGLTLDTQTMVVPASPPDPVEYVFDTSALVKQALDNRMEMLELELRLAADAANIAFARNQTLPLLTLDYTYRVNGLGGSTQDSFHTLQRNRFEDWELGLTAEIPLGNEAARSRLRSAILERIQRLSTKQARELAITQEVLNAVDAIDSGWQRVLAARQSVILNRRTLQAEQRQFDVGGSTSTNVLDAATRLAEAEFAEARALADYQIAQVDLAFATGTLLGASKVTWSPEPEPSTGQGNPVEELPNSSAADNTPTPPAQP